MVSVSATDAALGDASEGSCTRVLPVTSEPFTEGLCGGTGSELRGDETREGRLEDRALSVPSRKDSVVVDSDCGMLEPLILHRAKT